jgi:hypothetical protein
MKYVPLFLFFTIFAFAGCSKSNENSAGILTKNISGKWKYTQRFYSPGGPLIYESTTQLSQWIAFDNSEKLTSNMPSFGSFNNYHIMDSIKIKLSSRSQPDRLYFYKIDSVKNSLTLSPADYICIEGCGDIFQR